VVVVRKTPRHPPVTDPPRVAASSGHPPQPEQVSAMLLQFLREYGKPNLNWRGKPTHSAEQVRSFGLPHWLVPTVSSTI
jgi:hypothetical protein